ncbi:hypothetical protein [Denitrobacterium detoxificans]|uniref:hypothetical protein n=1 Tax=Denitrobacterium detoxificans TaxID=79604 RepID=UPI0011601511|nr:hypothetical protein [Denitrobacterium detoxificans]
MISSQNDTAPKPKFDYAIGAVGVLWEAKCPDGNGYLAVAGNIAKADTKFRKAESRLRIVLSNLDSAMNDKRFLKHFEESLSDPESDYSNVQEILFALKDGSVTRWENK